jgi:HTH-type transcriptional regulator, competence development regulator
VPVDNLSGIKTKYVLTDEFNFVFLTKLVKIITFNLKTTGQIIRQKREAKGILLRELSASLKIDPAILSKLERGERNPTRKLLSEISILLDINEKDLILEWISDKIIYDIADEEYGYEALKIAEQKAECLKSKTT